MGWIDKISNTISNMFKLARKPFPTIPPELLLCNVLQKPGLSAALLASAIIARLPEMGLDTGKNKDGSENKINQFVRILSEEIVNHFRDNANIQCVISPESLTITGTGGNAGGPVQIMGYNIAGVTVNGEVH